MSDLDFLYTEIDRENESSFILRLHDDCYFDMVKFERLIEICLNLNIIEREIRAQIADIFYMTSFLMLCHRDSNDLFKIANFDTVNDKFCKEYFHQIRQILAKFIKE